MCVFAASFPARHVVHDKVPFCDERQFLVDLTRSQPELDELRLSLDPEPTVLPLWSRPGITFALDGTGIGFPWYAWRDRAVAAATIEGACAEDGFVPAGQIVLVQEVNRPELGSVGDALSTCGINFPDDFTLIDTVVAPGDLELRIFLDDRSG